LEQQMRSFWKAAAVALAMGAAAAMPAMAQPSEDYGSPAAPDGYYDDGGYYQGTYDDGAYGDDYYGDQGYDDPYADAYYGEDAYGYCDEYGCPDDYWALPVYYGPVFYDDIWFNGPLYYRDWGGRRQYWIRGGWRYDGWRGSRPAWYREGRYGPALGLNWYRAHHIYRQGWHGNRGTYAYRGRSNGRSAYGGPGYRSANRFSTRADNRFRTGIGNGYSRRNFDRRNSTGFNQRNWQDRRGGNIGSFNRNGGRNWSGGQHGFRNQFSQRSGAGFGARSTTRGSGGRGGAFQGSGHFGGGGHGHRR
jgi:hypothetical protein